MDIHTLHVEHAVLLAVYTLLTVVNARIHQGIRGIHWFSLYNALLFAGALLVALRGHVPDLLSIVAGNMFVVAGYVALFVSLSKFFGAKFFGAKLNEISFQLGLAVVGLAAMVQYGWLEPETNKRLLAYSIVLAAQQTHVAIFTARKERRHGHAAMSMAMILGLLAAMNVFRIVTVVMHGVPQNYLSVKGSLVLLVLVNTALQCGAIVAYVWMTASRLRGDLKVQATTDPLTGMLNRRAMDYAAGQILAASAGRQHTSAIAIDLNDFKRVNDTFGHGCGDEALTAVARCLKLGLRNSDYVGRMGGDEFVALLPDTPVALAREIAEKLDVAIRGINIRHGETDTVIRLSASFGCAEAQSPHNNWGHLLLECDKNMYRAKKRRTRGVVREEQDELQELAG